MVRGTERIAPAVGMLIAPDMRNNSHHRNGIRAELHVHPGNRMQEVDLVAVGERDCEVVGRLVHGLPELHVLQIRLKVHIGLALAEIDLAGVKVEGNVARAVVRLHLADAADGHDHVRIGGVQMLLDGVDVRHLLEQLRL